MLLSLRNLCLIQNHKGFSRFPFKSFRFRSIIHFDLMFDLIKGMDQKSHFCIWMSISSILYLKGYLFSNELPLDLCWKSTYMCESISGLYSVDLFLLSLHQCHTVDSCSLKNFQNYFLFLCFCIFKWIFCNQLVNF